MKKYTDTRRGSGVVIAAFIVAVVVLLLGYRAHFRHQRAIEAEQLAIEQATKQVTAYLQALGHVSYRDADMLANVSDLVWPERFSDVRDAERRVTEEVAQKQWIGLGAWVQVEKFRNTNEDDSLSLHGQAVISVEDAVSHVKSFLTVNHEFAMKMDADGQWKIHGLYAANQGAVHPASFGSRLKEAFKYWF